MKGLTLLTLFALISSVSAAAPNHKTQNAAPSASQETSASAEHLTRLLKQFLADASSGNRAGFERFFADDVVYTGSTGVVRNKSQILQGVKRLQPTTESATTYSAEDIVVHEYGDAAVIAFRLVARTKFKDGRVATAYYRNTGTFARRNGRWQAVAWQATQITPSKAAK